MDIEKLIERLRARDTKEQEIYDGADALSQLQAENAELRRELEEARSALETIAAQSSGIPGSAAKSDCMASVANIALRNMKAARQQQG